MNFCVVLIFRAFFVLELKALVVLLMISFSTFVLVLTVDVIIDAKLDRQIANLRFALRQSAAKPRTISTASDLQNLN